MLASDCNHNVATTGRCRSPAMTNMPLLLWILASHALCDAEATSVSDCVASWVDASVEQRSAESDREPGVPMAVAPTPGDIDATDWRSALATPGDGRAGPGLRVLGAVAHWAIAPEQFAFVYDGLVFIRPVTPAEVVAWGRGSVQCTCLRDHIERGTEPGRDGLATGVVDVAVDKLPERWRAWLDARLLVRQGRGRPCNVSVDKVAVLARTIVGYNQTGPVRTSPGVHLSATLNRLVWPTVPHWLAGRLRASHQGGCAETGWARFSALPQPPALTTKAIPCSDRNVVASWPLVLASNFAQSLNDRILESDEGEVADPLHTPVEMARNLPAQRRYASRSERGLWTDDVSADGDRCEARVYLSENGPVAHEIRIVDWRGDGKLFELFGESGQFALWGALCLVVPRPANAPALLQVCTIRAALDLDGDGLVEWLGDETLWRLGPSGPEALSVGHELEDSDLWSEFADWQRSVFWQMRRSLSRPWFRR